MANMPCADCIRLKEVVLKAVEDVYAAHAAYHLALAEKRDSALHAVYLQDARTAELVAVAALDKHRKGHGC
jgi:hypothetical protein